MMGTPVRISRAAHAIHLSAKKSRINFEGTGEELEERGTIEG